MAHFLYGIEVCKNLEYPGMNCTPIWGVELQCYAGDCDGHSVRGVDNLFYDESYQRADLLHRGHGLRYIQ